MTLLGTYYTYYGVSGTNNPHDFGDYRFYFQIYLDSQSTSNNTSTITIREYMQIVGSGFGMPNATTGTSINSGSFVSHSQGYKDWNIGTYLMGTRTATIYHNSDGTGSFSFLGRGSVSNSGPWIYTANPTITLPTIPRAPSYNSINASNITLNSVRLTASIDTKGLSVTGGGWDLSTDGGATWTYYDGDVYDKTITGLNPGTQYWYRGYVVSSGGGANSWWGTFTTTQQATITNSNVDFDIDNGIVLTFTNPSGKDVDLFLESPNGTVRATRESITSPYTLSLTTAEKNTLFGLAPTSNTLAFRFKLRTDDNDSYVSYKTGTASISNANPIFNNFEYEDINPITLALTGNNQTIIKGYSTLRAIISTSNKAVAQKGASIVSYQLVVGEKQKTVAYSDSTDVNIDLTEIDNNVFTVYAIDSRGNSTSKQKSPATYIDYFEPHITSPIPTAIRTNGIGTETKLTFKGKFYNNNFGVKQNTITVTYQYKKTNVSTWTTGTTTLTPTINGNDFSFSGLIAGDLGANGFDQQYSYNIRLIISDEITSIIYDGIILGTGKPNIAIHRDGVAFGAPYDEEKGGPLQIEGKTLLDFFYPIGSIYMSVNSTNPSSLFGGTWVQLIDRFLVGAGGTYEVGATGGASTVALTEAQLGAHSHYVNLTSSWAGEHTHPVFGLPTTGGSAYGLSSATGAGGRSDIDVTYGIILGQASPNGNHYHTISGWSNGTGGGQAHENKPPYRAVYIWYRST